MSAYHRRLAEEQKARIAEAKRQRAAEREQERRAAEAVAAILAERKVPPRREREWPTLHVMPEPEVGRHVTSGRCPCGRARRDTGSGYVFHKPFDTYEHRVRPFAVEANAAESVVYYVSDGAFVKIGVAVDLKRRLSALQIGNPRPLTVVAAEPGDQRIERLRHERFKALRVTGEWFTLAPELEEHIAAVNAAGSAVTFRGGARPLYEIEDERDAWERGEIEVAA